MKMKNEVYKNILTNYEDVILLFVYFKRFFNTQLIHQLKTILAYFYFLVF